ncbi:MAG: response regulator [Chitinivibrionales bacterium]|nr:response regulator [Chitinivibrionales bacterium]
MLSNKPCVLIIEDDEAAAFGYESFLSDSGYRVKSATTLKEAHAQAEQGGFDAILLDLKLPDGNSLHWIPQQKQAYPEIPIIVITGTSDIPTAVQATKNGAENFLTKPVEMDELKNALDKSLELKVLRKRSVIQQRLSKSEEPFFGRSRPVTELLDYAALAAANNSVILLQGETGTGKGVLAKWVHDNSERRSEAFVELNCSSLKGELLRSELFGHVKGAFTSAIKDREGLIEVADNGTLFLDEIGDMDLEVQAQLLKTIEEKSFRRIGENKIRKSDFRLICASNRDLFRATKEQKFRNDLYYRICVFPVIVPPLRERIDDIPGLAAYFLKSFGYTHFPLSHQVSDTLKRYSWPGNVRELKNMLERAFLLARGEPLTIHHFPGLTTSQPITVTYEDVENLNELTNRHILSIVRKYNGDKKKASKALGMSFSNLYRKLSQIGHVEEPSGMQV